MFVINKDQSIYLTRGDIANIGVQANISDSVVYTFAVGDIVRFKVFEPNKCEKVVLVKDVNVTEETYTAIISLGAQDTRIGSIINKPKDYWYEIELNPNTTPQTIIGYDLNGPKIFRLYPEGGDIE